MHTEADDIEVGTKVKWRAASEEQVSMIVRTCIGATRGKPSRVRYRPGMSHDNEIDKIHTASDIYLLS